MAATFYFTNTAQETSLYSLAAEYASSHTHTPANAGTTVDTDAAPGSASAAPIAVWTTSTQAHSGVNWDTSSAISCSVDVTIASSDLTYSADWLRVDTTRAGLRGTGQVLSNSTGTGIKTGLNGWSANGSALRDVKDRLGFLMRATNANMMTAWAVTLRISDSDSYIGCASLTPPGGTPTGTATLSGSGTLTATGIPTPTGTATLSGSGTLTATGAAHVARTVALSGSGTVRRAASEFWEDFESPVKNQWSLSGDGTAVIADGRMALTVTGTQYAFGESPEVFLGPGMETYLQVGTTSSWPTYTEVGCYGVGASSPGWYFEVLDGEPSLYIKNGSGGTTSVAIASLSTYWFRSRHTLSGTAIDMLVDGAWEEQLSSLAVVSGTVTFASLADYSEQNPSGANLWVDDVNVNDPATGPTGSAALAGSGTLAVTGSPAPVGAAPLSGSGALAATGTAAHTGTASLSGPGELSASAELPLTVPTGLVATAISTTQIDLIWDAVAAASAYDVERDGQLIATDVLTTSFSDIGLDQGEQHAYRVRAVR